MDDLIKTIYLETEKLRSLRIEQRENTIEFYEVLNEWPILVLTYKELKEILEKLDHQHLYSEILKNLGEKLP